VENVTAFVDTDSSCGFFCSLEKRHYGRDDAPTACATGYGMCRCEYDKQGRLARESNSGKDGFPLLTLQGYAFVAFQYDEDGQLTGKRYLDMSGRPVNSPQE
jgi:hypothetical protein